MSTLRHTLSLVAAAALFAAFAPGRAAYAQVAADDDIPLSPAPAPQPRAPAAQPQGPAPAQPMQPMPPPPGPRPVAAPRFDRMPAAEGASADAPPPLPPGAVAAPGYPTPRYKLRYEERRMTGLMAAGLGVLGGTWLLTATFGGYVYDHGWFAIPVFGPVIYKTDDKAQEAALIMDTIVQAGGLAMALAGAFVKQKVAVREPIAVIPVPIVLPGGGGGLAASGSW